ncbi:MAG: hypothetical protein GXP23_02780 [Gammaproteobacteria bacterium]|nr:hypothetical protein [Gammaproteobacteria bacterium]
MNNIFVSTLFKTLLFLVVFNFSSITYAQAASSTDPESESDIEKKNSPGDFWIYQEIDSEQVSDPISKSFGFVLNKSHQFANWVDRFFDDDRTKGIKNTTRMKLSYWVYREEESKYDDSDLSFNIRIKLPRTAKRVQFVITNDPDENLANSRSGGVFPDQQRNDETTAGFRFFDLLGFTDKIVGEFTTSMAVGFSSGKLTFRVEPRYIYTHDFGTWSTTFLQKIRWHSRDKWRTETRLDFDRALSKKYFLRFNNEILWEQKQDDYDGIEFRPRVVLSRRFSDKQALLYEWNNLFRSKPDFTFHTTSLALRYRRQIWRPWLFVEVTPQVSFRNEDDWRISPGIFAKLEILAKKTDK